MSERDYAAEMHAIMLAEMANGEPLPDVAERIVEKLRQSDPDLLAGWLDLNARIILREAMGEISRTTRARARTSSRGVFADMAEAKMRVAREAARDGYDLGT